ncbi:MAG: B12-binding domain-containing radical SAM protein [Deltaproteobacteria bacterium]|nr:B12-binding domain-containing radical SAM protein [Deltaproteobacteria bacterium]
MRFLLINPYYPITEDPSPPLGLAYVAAVLERAGIEVEILDFVVFPYSKKLLETRLKDFPPDVVGLTSVTMNFNNAFEVLRDVKNINPEIFTVMGGPHVTFCAVETMQSVLELDCVVLGEGEDTIVELAGALERRHSLESVLGIVYRDGVQICHTGVRKRPLDMDSLPLPARHLLPMARYHALDLYVTMTTSRACPFSCTFCVGRKMFGSRVRFRNPAAIINEFEGLSKLDFGLISFADDLFTAKKAHCLYICEEIIRRGIKQKWVSFARVDMVSKELLEKMKEAGCNDICFGVESGNPGILKTIKKGISLDQVVTAVEMCGDVGITPMASFIVGLPGETPETLKETVEFALKLNNLGARYGFHLLAPFPGTEIREESDRYGITILTDDWSQYHANRAIVETPDVSRETLNEIVIQWENRFNAWRESIGMQMKKGNATEDDSRQLQEIERRECIYKLMMDNLIEEKGSWPVGNDPVSDVDALKTLVERLEGSIDKTPEQVFHHLKYVMDRKDLRYIRTGRQICWEWTDFLP